MNKSRAYFLALLLLFCPQLPAKEALNEKLTKVDSQAKELSTFYSIENLEDITNDDIDKLLEYQTAIKFESHLWTEKELEAFRSELLRKWVRGYDWTKWQEKAISYYKNPELLKEADLVDIVKLITLHVRKEKFCGGHLLDMIQSGHMNKILGRIRKIRTENMMSSEN